VARQWAQPLAAGTRAHRAGAAAADVEGGEEAGSGAGQAGSSSGEARSDNKKHCCLGE